MEKADLVRQLASLIQKGDDKQLLSILRSFDVRDGLGKDFEIIDSKSRLFKVSLIEFAFYVGHYSVCRTVIGLFAIDKTRDFFPERSNYYYSTMRHCIDNERTYLLDLLLSDGIVFHHSYFEEAAVKACSTGNTQLVDYYLTKFNGLSPIIRIKQLIFAVRSGNCNEVKHLICDKEVNVNAKSKMSMTATMETACQTGNIEMAVSAQP